MSNNYNGDYHEELLLNSGGSATKTIHNIDVDATPEQIKDIILCNHCDLKTPSQRLHAFNSIQQKPDEALLHGKLGDEMEGRFNQDLPRKQQISRPASSLSKPSTQHQHHQHKEDERS